MCNNQSILYYIVDVGYILGIYIDSYVQLYICI